MPWLKIASGIVLMALGGAIAIWGYATPRIDGLQRQMADMKAADAQQTASFMMATAVKQAQLQAQADQAEAKYVALQADTAKSNARSNAVADSLRGTISCYASGNCGGLPKEAGNASCTDDKTNVLAGLLAESVGLVAEGKANALTASDQITALQALQ